MVVGGIALFRLNTPVKSRSNTPLKLNAGGACVCLFAFTMNELKFGTVAGLKSTVFVVTALTFARSSPRVTGKKNGLNKTGFWETPRKNDP